MIKPIRLNHRTVDKYKQAVKIGILGASMMIAYLLVIEVITAGTSYGLKFLKYFFLAIPMAFGLCKMSKGEGFNNPYLPQSTFYTAVIATTAATVVLLAYWVTLPLENINMATIVSPSLTAQGALSNANALPLPVPFLLFLEVFAMGMIIGFGILVYGSELEEVLEDEQIYTPVVKIKKAA